MFGRDLLGNVRMRIVHFDSIYAQKDSFAHRYGFSEICGCVPLDLGCFGPVARSRRALTSGARRAAVSEAVCLPAGPLVAGPLVAGLRQLDAVFCSLQRERLFFMPPLRPEARR